MFFNITWRDGEGDGGNWTYFLKVGYVCENISDWKIGYVFRSKCIQFNSQCNWICLLSLSQVQFSISSEKGFTFGEGTPSCWSFFRVDP